MPSSDPGKKKTRDTDLLHRLHSPALPAPAVGRLSPSPTPVRNTPAGESEARHLPRLQQHHLRWHHHAHHSQQHLRHLIQASALHIGQGTHEPINLSKLFAFPNHDGRKRRSARGHKSWWSASSCCCRMSCSRGITWQKKTCFQV